MSSASTKDQLARLLALAPYLQARGEVPLREVAADFSVSPDQILKDLRVLYMCGLPGFGPGELIDINVEALLDDPDGLVRIDNAEYLARPLRLGSNEASALIVALRALLDSSTVASREVVERTLAKLEAATEAGALPLVDVRVPEQRPALTKARNELEWALRTNKQARIQYVVPSRDETTDRVVDPIALLLQDGKTYLDAWCHQAEARRLFRVDRISSVSVLETDRERHDLTPRDLAEGLFESSPDDLVVRLRLTARMRWFAEYYPVLSVTDTPDDGLEVTLAVSDELWLLRLAMRFGHGLTVLEPAELSDRIRGVAQDALRLQRATAYDETDSTTSRAE
ncbi:WYL domain-containing protein [Nocardioides marmoriginsengisoli]|uniref:WYL domain-containing protein n=1 Tax=Nocardioides marmoriginsengisoli TaxID=661483 RepID=A0A3N0CQU9_9ACTN|nr:WYL domain-containing protein [Nocardioides marmoriginsengisoli]RNL65760.1 WYL domain-containing protein [Nocardioides marmoriginsengisoli]